ncbi:MAG: AmmeMemoRadiSam system protein A [Nitrospiraceae bacterium]|nr:AmmeMemoRadiSam system protein A [Nitrospiraceae bacterium]
MHPFVDLVRKAVELYVKEGRVVADTGELSGEMIEKAGVFVCLKKKGRLRGCIGTIEPATACAAQEAIRNAIASASEDPRFPPVAEHELDDLDYSVDVLCPPEKIKDLSDLDVKRYGVIVVKGGRKGLLLPDLEGVDTVEDQFRVAMAKAGIPPWEKDLDIYRFEVKRYL